MWLRIAVSFVVAVGIFHTGLAQSQDAKSCETEVGANAGKPACCAAPKLTSAKALEVKMPNHVLTLDQTLEPFINTFNKNSNKPRFVSILSPTCGDCVTGAKAIQKHMIEAFPELDMDFLIVWSPVVNTDAGADLLDGINMMKDPRVQHFWDPNIKLGKVLKEHFPLGKRPFAWDIYLFYGKGELWTSDTAPKVFAWSHQLDALGANDANPTFYRLGEQALGSMFRETIAKLDPVKK